MRCDNLPRAVELRPNIGETVAVFVRFTLGSALFVIRANDHDCAAVCSNLKIRHFCKLYVESRVPVVRNLAKFAKCAPVFYVMMKSAASKDSMVAISPRL